MRRMLHALCVVGSALCSLAACSDPEAWHPSSHYARDGVVPYHHKVVTLDGRRAVVSGTEYPVTWVWPAQDGHSGAHGHGVRYDVEVQMRGYGDPPFVLDAALAKQFVRRACKELTGVPLNDAEPGVVAEGYVRFEGVSCRFL